MDYQCRIISNDQLKGLYRKIIFEAPELARAAQPGQFVHVRISQLRDRILRRPFSICEVDTTKGMLTIVYKIVGEGTEELARMSPGMSCAVMGPLGRGYTIPGKDVFPVLVAGGYGSASTLFLAERSKSRGILLLGARSDEDLILADEHRAYGFDVFFATNDGSVGHKGFVTELLDEALKMAGDKIPVCCGCGPTPMLYALGEAGLKRGVKTELSLDHHMCCGVGACFACVIKIKDETNAGSWRYSRTCKEGPVYSAEEVYYA